MAPMGAAGLRRAAVFDQRSCGMIRAILFDAARDADLPAARGGLALPGNRRAARDGLGRRARWLPAFGAAFKAAGAAGGRERMDCRGRRFPRGSATAPRRSVSQPRRRQSAGGAPWCGGCWPPAGEEPGDAGFRRDVRGPVRALRGAGGVGALPGGGCRCSRLCTAGTGWAMVSNFDRRLYPVLEDLGVRRYFDDHRDLQRTGRRQARRPHLRRRARRPGRRPRAKPSTPATTQSRTGAPPKPRACMFTASSAPPEAWRALPDSSCSCSH